MSKSIKKKAIYTGIIFRLIWFARSPKRGGIKVEPTYALAIWIPIMPWEFSAPKLFGVEWIMQGYTGAQPRPMTTKPISETMLTGIAISAAPTSAREVPSLIILLSPSLSEIKPERNLPAVMPIKKSEPNAAASSFETPLAPSR